LSPLSDSSTFLGGVLGPIVVMGIGAGLTFAPITGVIMHFAPEEHASAASSLLQTMQQLGGSIGVAALTTVFVSITTVSGEAHGISTAILGGVAFVALAFVLFAIWGRRIPADATAGGADASGGPILH
jgi:disulfide bond formation protein DsbB